MNNQAIYKRKKRQDVTKIQGFIGSFIGIYFLFYKKMSHALSFGII